MNIRYWLFQKGWVVILPIILAILAIWVWPGLHVPPLVVGESSQALYLLSAIAQSLAAILALVFTVSLITFQLSARYSQRVIGQFFNKFTITYIVVFVISILLPLWTIMEPDYYRVKVCLSLAGVSVLLLIPYFLDLRERLSPEKMLLDLRRKTLKIIGTKPTKCPEEIVTLDNFVMSAFASKDYETYRVGVDTLARLAYEADKQGRSERDEDKDGKSYSNFELSKHIYEILEDIASSTLDDPRVPGQITSAIWRSAITGIQEGLGDCAEAAVIRLEFIALQSAQRGNDGATERALTLLRSIGMEAAKRNINTSGPESESLTECCLDAIAALGQEAINTGLRESIAESVNSVSSIAESCVEIGNLEIPAKCLNVLSAIVRKAPSELLTEGFGSTACRRLIRLGILFTVHQCEEEQNEAVSQLKYLEANVGSGRVKFMFDFDSKRWSDKWEKQIIQFRELYYISSGE